MYRVKGGTKKTNPLTIFSIKSRNIDIFDWNFYQRFYRYVKYGVQNFMHFGEHEIELWNVEYHYDLY